MGFIKKELILLSMVVSFLGAYIGSAKAADYYYDSFPGLFETTAEGIAPFYELSEGSSPINVSMSVAPEVVLDNNQASDTLGITLIPIGSVDYANVDVRVASIYGNNLIEAAVSGTGNMRTLDIINIGGGLSGTSEVELLLVYNGIAEERLILDVVIDSNCPLYGSDSIDTISTTSASGTGHSISCDALGNYLLASADDLLHLSHNQANTTATGSTTIGSAIVSGDYKMLNDITFSVDVTVNKTYDGVFLDTMEFVLDSNEEDWNGDGFVDDDDDDGWIPIASIGGNFTGVFDGNYNSINNLYINKPNDSLVGMFKMISNGAVIKNLALNNANVSAKGKASIISYTLWTGSSIDNCYSTGNVKSEEDNASGLMGVVFSSIVSNSYSEADVLAYDTAGGLMEGTAVAGIAVENCYASGKVTSLSGRAGGLMGVLGTQSIINDSYATGSVRGVSDVGGLIGMAGYATVNNSYSSSPVKGEDSVGGVFGKAYTHLSSIMNINNSYANWDIPPVGNTQVGGLIGNDGDNMMEHTPQINNEDGLCEEYNSIDPDNPINCTIANANTIQTNGVVAGAWDPTVWNLDGSARPTLINMPTF